MKHVSPEEAHALMARGVPYVDVRTPEEFEAGHPAEAWNLPISEPDFAFVASACFDKSAPIVLGCRSGHRSVMAAKVLESEGFTDVHEQRAGWDGARDAFGRVTEAGWRKAGLPSELGSGGERSFGSMKAKANP
jgi:rhodanese-related sulfurtransferase